MKVIDKNGNLKIFDSPNGVAGGDLSGSYPSPTVTQLNGFALPYYISGYVNGLQLAYVSTTSISVAPGEAVDSTGSRPIALGTIQTISTGTLGALNGLDRTAITGTVAATTANATVTGTGTAFTTAFSPISLGTGFSSSSTTLTLPAGFCPQPGPMWPIAVGDLIGNASKGYYRVTAIGAWAASGQTLTLVSAPGSAFVSGDALYRIENAWFQAGTNTPLQINTITSDTSLTTSANGSAIVGGVTGYIGALPSGQVALHVWIGVGTSGTGVWLSTQRTTPFGPAGYDSYYRRIGSVVWDGATPTILPFVQRGSGPERWMQLEVARSTHGNQLANSSPPASWTALVCNTLAPPSANWFFFDVSVITGAEAFLRCRGVGDSTVTRPRENFLQTGQNVSYVGCACDGGQAVEWGGNAGSGASVWFAEYQESLAFPFTAPTATAATSSTTSTSSLADANTNVLINGGLDFAQRQAPGTLTNVATNAADKYGADRWKVGIQNGLATAQAQYVRTDTLTARETGLPARYYGTLKMTGAASKAMTYQPVEAVNTLPLQGQTVTFQVLLKASTAQIINLGVLSLGSPGTADTIPSILNSSWSNTSGVDPTWASNVALVGSKVACSVTTSWQLFSVTVTVPAGSFNLLPVIWTDGQLAINATFSWSQAGLFLSSGAVTWTARPEQQELAMCERYYEKAYNIDDAPGTTWSVGAGAGYPQFGLTSGASISASWCFRQKKRVAPTLTLYSAAGTSGQVSTYNGSWVSAAPSSSGVTQSAFSLQMTTGEYYVNFSFTADADL